MSASLRQMVRAAKMSDELIVTPRLVPWLLQHGDDALPPDVMQRIAKIASTKPRIRSSSFSSSSAGNCLRRQAFEYLGVPMGGSHTPTLVNLFNDGKWRHLRWQATLLAAGILDDIEVPLRWPAQRSMGSADGYGVVPDTHPKYGGRDFGFELKGINPYGFDRRDKEGEPMLKHLQQVHRYFLSSGFDLFVILYECKATQRWIEFVIEEDPDMLEQQRSELVHLNRAVDTQTLPPRLHSCQAKFGPEFNECPFGGVNGPCHKFDNWV